MIASDSQRIVDFYPIVVALDDDILDDYKDNSASLYNTVASEASWFASERSWRLDEENVEIQNAKKENEHKDVASPTQRRRKLGDRFLNKNPPSPPSLCRTHSCGSSYRQDCDEEFGRKGKSTPMVGVFDNIRSLLQLGSHRTKRTYSLDKNPGPEDIAFSNISPIQSPSRVGSKLCRPRRFHDEYVLTQEVSDFVLGCLACIEFCIPFILSQSHSNRSLLKRINHRTSDYPIKSFHFVGMCAPFYR